jgi:hypothetical protein
LHLEDEMKEKRNGESKKSEKKGVKQKHTRTYKKSRSQEK